MTIAFGCPAPTVSSGLLLSGTSQTPMPKKCIGEALRKVSGTQPDYSSYSTCSKTRTFRGTRPYAETCVVTAHEKVELHISLPSGVVLAEELAAAHQELEDLRTALSAECATSVTIDECWHSDRTRRPCPVSTR
jgi:hypothetical protein